MIDRTVAVMYIKQNIGFVDGILVLQPTIMQTDPSNIAHNI